MPAKAKPRKPAATPAASKEATPNDCSEIGKLIARYGFLRADQVYQSAAAESDRMACMRSREPGRPCF